ncbi:YraN family protein [Wolbachia endosymbiont of Atemnus politus]
MIKHRYHYKFGEVDLIVSKKRELIFIEVKTSLPGQEIPISSLQ